VYDFLQQIKEVSLLFSQLRKVNLPLQNLKEFSPLLLLKILLLLLKILLLLILLLFHLNRRRRGSLMLVAPGKHHQLGTISLNYLILKLPIQQLLAIIAVRGISVTLNLMALQTCLLTLKLVLKTPMS
jgi:hypothetical protein